MNKLDLVKEALYQNLESKCFGYKKKNGYDHLFGVSSLCSYLAVKRNLDIELAAIIGMLHDYSTFITGTSFDHAYRSSTMVKELLMSLNFEEHDINIIVEAIKNHSDKNKVHDEYSELIKDADVLHQYFTQKDAIFSDDYNHRLIKLL